MPAQIEHIDAIARRRGRATPYLEFHPRRFGEWCSYRHEDDAARAAAPAWPDTEALPAYRVLRDSLALRNAAHDEPGFWDRWAENF